ncbi:MAG: hypothetical protein ACYC9I_08555 [Desulfuromonadales bacterium]
MTFDFTQTTKGAGMKIVSRLSMLLAFAMVLAGAQLITTTAAHAQSSYFTSRGCVDCHSTPVVASCNACHYHGNRGLQAATSKTSYTPGETVSVTLTSTSTRSGWIKANLYNQSNALVASSNGTASGMGGSTTFPATLTAPAPTTPGTYTWRMAYYGNQNGNSPGDIHTEAAVSTNSFTVAAPADTTLPTVGAFTLPATSTSLTVPVSSLTASDNVAVTGYLVTTSATKPLASAAGWSASAPTSVTAPAAGSVTFYAWAKDAAGNVSASSSASVVITLPDTAAPTVGAFTLPATSTSLTVPVSSLTASDNVAVTGYLVNTSATKPAASAAGWSATAPTSVTAPAAGSVTFYAWTKDAAGNVSASSSASVVISTSTIISKLSAFPEGSHSSGAKVTFTASGQGGSGNYEYQFWLKAGPVWKITQPYSPIDTWTWDTAGLATGSYQVVVWVRNTGSTANYEAYSSQLHDITSTASAVTLTPSVASPQVAGTPVTFTGVGQGGTGSYEYQFWLKAGTVWKITQAYSSKNTWTWDTAGLAAGSYQVVVWVRNTGSTANYKAYSSQLYNLNTEADISKPVLNVSTLPDGSVTNNQTLNISGFATDDVALKSVAVNGSIIQLDVNGNFTTAVVLVDGTNSIKVVATDVSGNSTTISRTITFTVNAPSLSVTAPVDNLVSAQDILVVRGTVSELSTVSVTVNGGSPQLASLSGNVFTASVYLTEGLNTIAIQSVDPTGTISNAKRTVMFDNSNPTIAITEPDEDKIVSNQTLEIKGRVADIQSKVTVKLTMGDKVYNPVIREGRFEQSVTFTEQKQYTIVATATDEAGNQVSVSRNVIYKK